MKPDLLDELRACDPVRENFAAPDPDWDEMAERILAPARPRRRPPRRRLALVAGPIAAITAAAVAALVSGHAPPSVLERAYAAVTHNAVYHYAATTQELEGPERRPLADTRSTREGWIDPTTGEIHEILAGGDEWATDGRRRTVYTAFNNALQVIDEPSPTDPAGQTDANVFNALTRSYRAGALRDAGTGTFEGRRVRRLVAVNETRTWRQTFLVDAESYLPVRVVTETGEHIRTGRTLAPRQRVIEERFTRFERLPEDADRSLLRMRPHPHAQSRRAEPLPAPATP